MPWQWLLPQSEATQQSGWSDQSLHTGGRAHGSHVHSASPAQRLGALPARHPAPAACLQTMLRSRPAACGWSGSGCGACRPSRRETHLQRRTQQRRRPRGGAGTAVRNGYTALTALSALHAQALHCLPACCQRTGGLARPCRPPASYPGRRGRRCNPHSQAIAASLPARPRNPRQSVGRGFAHVRSAARDVQGEGVPCTARGPLRLLRAPCALFRAAHQPHRP